MSNIIVDTDGKSISSNDNGSIHINISQTEKNGIYGFDDIVINIVYRQIIVD